MGTCKEYETLISAFIDGALDEESRAKLMAHMAGCPACQAYFDDQIAIHDALDHMEAQAPEDFTARVMEQVRREPRQPAAPEKAEEKTVAFPYWRRFAALAACCALVALAGFWAFGGQPDMGNTAGVAADRSLPSGAEGNSSAVTGEDTSAGAAAETDDGDAQPAQEEGPADDTVEIDGTAVGNAAAEQSPPPANGQSIVSPVEDSTQEKEVAPSLYTVEQGPSAVLTTGSRIAADWVAEILGESWEAGASYTLTEEQFAQVKALLEENGESFTEQTPSDGAADANDLPAAGGNSVTDSGPVTYVLQAAP